MELKGPNYLKRKLEEKRIRVKTRYEFYEMKNYVQDFNISTPEQLKDYMSSIGWAAKAVDSFADRLVFRGFKNDSFALNQIYRMNNMDVLTDSAITSAAISACSFVYITKDEEGYPRLQVIDGGNATGIIDDRTNLLLEGYAVLERDNNDQEITEAYFIPGRTDYYINGQYVTSIENQAPAPLLVPIINRPDAKRPFGHSRISRACMDIICSAVRTIKRSEISAEFFSFPQKYITGLSEDNEKMDRWKATMAAILTITKGDDGNDIKVGQFAQQSMVPHKEHLEMFASLFAGETGLTLDDLGISKANPSSAEGIKATHENLRLAVRKAQRDFGTGFLNVGYIAACIRDDVSYKRNEIYNIKPMWEPIFEPDSNMLSGIGDGVIKINQAIPNYFDKQSLRDLTGIDSSGE